MTLCVGDPTHEYVSACRACLETENEHLRAVLQEIANRAEAHHGQTLDKETLAIARIANRARGEAVKEAAKPGDDNA